jgi:hypothetical protein
MNSTVVKTVLLMGLAVVATTACAASPESGTPTTGDQVLQLPLGKPLDRALKRCPPVSGRPSVTVQTDWCGRDRAYPVGAKVAEMHLRAPHDPDVEHAVPFWVVMSPDVTIYLKDGVIHTIHVPVWHVDAKDEKAIIDSVSQRFGPPASERRDGYGEAFRRKDVKWRSAAGSASFMCLTREECGVQFRSLQLTQEIEARQAGQAAREALRPRAP